MKKILTLCIAFLFVSIFMNDKIQAQNKKNVKNKNFWYMMKNADGSGEEIHDNIIFDNNKVISNLHFSYNERRWTELKKIKINEEEVSVKFSLRGNENSVYEYDCLIQNEIIYGTIKRRNSDGTTTQMLMRGMTAENYQRIKDEKEKFRKMQTGN